MSASPALEARLSRMEQAAEWLQRMREPGADEQVMEAWLDWCQRDPRNQQAFDDMASVWEASGRLGESQPAIAAPEPVNHSRRALAASLAGIGVAMAAGGWWWTRNSADGRAETVQFAAPVGVNRREQLPDGSVLELGGGTRVSVVMAAQSRRVQLHEGEIFVSVQHDPSRPFSVESGRMKVVATGTAFNVLRTAGRTTVTVTEGSVETLATSETAAAPNVRLKPGDQLIYAHDARGFEVRQVNADDVIAWRSGMLRFVNTPLAEVIASVNRYARHKAAIEDPRVGALSFTGTARTDRIDSWLQALPQIFEVTITPLPDGRQLIGPRSSRDRQE